MKFKSLHVWKVWIRDPRFTGIGVDRNSAEDPKFVAASEEGLAWGKKKKEPKQTSS